MPISSTTDPPPFAKANLKLESSRNNAHLAIWAYRHDERAFKSNASARKTGPTDQKVAGEGGLRAVILSRCGVRWSLLGSIWQGKSRANNEMAYENDSTGFMDKQLISTYTDVKNFNLQDLFYI